MTVAYPVHAPRTGQGKDMDALIAALHAAVAHKVIVVTVLMVAVIAVMVLARPGAVAKLALGLIALAAFGNLYAGHRVVGWLLDRHGVDGIGTLVSARETSSRLNGRNVKRYATLIRTADGRTIETSFDGFALPLHPTPQAGYLVPSPGVEFRVRHLASRPEVFSIRTDGDGAYAKGLGCAELAQLVNEARMRHEFDRASTEYRLAFAQAMGAYADAGCTARADASKPRDTGTAGAR